MTPSKLVPFINRQLRMCRETGPSSSHCSLRAGWNTADDVFFLVFFLASERVGFTFFFQSENLRLAPGHP